MGESAADRTVTTSEALDDRDVAERALAEARRVRESAEQVAATAARASRAATQTADAARAVLAAAQLAESYARETADVARATKVAARGQVAKAQVIEKAAMAAQEAAQELHRQEVGSSPEGGVPALREPTRRNREPSP